MKGAGLIAFVTLFSSLAYGQKRTSSAIPSFKMTLVDGSVFQASELETSKPVLLIYFDPGCEHCKTFTANIIKEYRHFSSLQVIMVSNYPITEIEKFDRHFSLSPYPNIRIGSEGSSLTVQKYYNVRQFPFVVLYHKNGEKKGQFEGSGFGVKDLLKIISRC